MNFRMRPATENEGPYLTELALRSKSHWDYDKEYLENCREALTITHSDIQDWVVRVIEVDSKIAGFFSLKHLSKEDRLDNFWLEPEFIGKGLGKGVFVEIINEAKNLGWRQFRLAADPKAAGFYKKMGGQQIGEIQSKIKPDLFLPHIEVVF